MSYNIEKLDINDYPKCNAIWDMQADLLTEKFRKEIENGNREVYVCKENENFIGEIACVYDMNDPDYTISGQRIYLSRLIVKPNYRNKVNSTPFVRQYDILSNRWGDFICQKEYQTSDTHRSSKNT